MKRTFSLALVLVALMSCSTETVVEPSDPERASELNAQLGLGYMQKGQYERALAKLDKAISFDSNNATAYHYKAELYRRLRQYQKAEDNFQRALELDPNDANAQNNYGVFLCDQEQYEKAYKHFNKIINDPLYRFKADAYENVGLCSYRQGRMQQAEQAFQSALAINNKMAKSIIKLALINYDRKNKAEAYAFFKRFLSLSGHNPESLWLGILLEKERGNKNAVSSYKVLLKGKFPASDEAKLLRKLEAQGKI